MLGAKDNHYEQKPAHPITTLFNIKGMQWKYSPLTPLSRKDKTHAKTDFSRLAWLDEGRFTKGNE